MAENMTEWQKIAAVLKQVANEPGQWSPKTVEIGMIPKLAEMIKTNYFAFASESSVNTEEGTVKVSYIEDENGKYVLVFPDEETAEKIGEKPVRCYARDIFAGAAGNADIVGLRLVYDYDENTKTFETALIPRRWLLGAVAVGIEAVKAETDAEIRKYNQK